MNACLSPHLCWRIEQGKAPETGRLTWRQCKTRHCSNIRLVSSSGIPPTVRAVAAHTLKGDRTRDCRPSGDASAPGLGSQLPVRDRVRLHVPMSGTPGNGCWAGLYSPPERQCENLG